MNTRNAIILALAAFLAVAAAVALSNNPVYAQYAPCQGYGQGWYGNNCYPGSSNYSNGNCGYYYSGYNCYNQGQGYGYPYYPYNNCGYYYSSYNCNYRGYGYYPYNNCGYYGCYPYYRAYNPYTTYNCGNGYYYATGYCSYYGSCRTCR